MVQQLAVQAEEGGNDKMEPPKQIVVARWVTAIFFDLLVDLLQNCWLHEPYFPAFLNIFKQSMALVVD